VLKKTIKYQDLDGNEVEEDFYFHLSKAELVELEMSEKSGLSEMLKQIVASEDKKKIIEEFKKIILMSYGQRSDNGRFFKKNQELRDEFQGSEAYSALFMEMLENEEAGIAFVNGIMPAELVAEAAKIAAEERQAEEPELAEVLEEDRKGLGPVSISGQRAESVDTPPAEDDEAGKGDN
jgi:hypothetical protein